jgi:hypothetical protein
LDVPNGKPVVILDQDQLDVNSRCLRVHMHGEAPAVSAPMALPGRPRPRRRLARAVLAAAILGTVAVSGGCDDTNTDQDIDVIEEPPVIVEE